MLTNVDLFYQDCWLGSLTESRRLGSKSNGSLEAIGEALLKTFESYLGSDWTPEVKQAWVDAYGAIAKFMLSGAENSTAAETRVRTALS